MKDSFCWDKPVIVIFELPVPSLLPALVMGKSAHRVIEIQQTQLISRSFKENRKLFSDVASLSRPRPQLARSQFFTSFLTLSFPPSRTLCLSHTGLFSPFPELAELPSAWTASPPACHMAASSLSFTSLLVSSSGRLCLYLKCLLHVLPFIAFIPFCNYFIYLLVLLISVFLFH